MLNYVLQWHYFNHHIIRYFGSVPTLAETQSKLFFKEYNFNPQSTEVD